MFFTTPVPMSPHSPDYYPRYYPGVSFAVDACATQYLTERHERAWALRYQQQPVKQPTPNSLLAQEYDEFPDEQCMTRVSLSCMPLDEEEQAFAHWRADAEKFLAEAETYLDEFLPPDHEPDLSVFRPFDLPDTPVPISTSKVPVQDEPLLEDFEDCVMTEDRLMAEYRFEVRDTLQSILDCLSAATEVPIERVPIPSTAAETC